MKQIIKVGTVSKRMVIFIRKTNVTTGVGLTGLTSASAGLTWYYYRESDNASTAVSIVGQTLGTWTSGGFVEIDATHLPGWYEIGVPNAVIANIAQAWMMLQGAASMVPSNIEIEVTNFDLQNATPVANVTQWLGIGVAANIGGIPKVDVADWLGTAVTAVTGGIPDVNVKNYNNQTAATDVNNLPKVDLEDIKGVAVSTTSAQLGANVVQFAGAAAALDANNFPKVDTEDWKGSAIVAPNLAGVPKVDVTDWLGTVVTAASAGIPDVNTKNFNNLPAQTDANNLPKVDVEDWKGAVAVAVSTAGLPKVDVVVNEDKTGYSLTQAFPTNFSALAITAGGAVTVGTNQDKTGYTLLAGQITVKKNQALAGFTFPMFSSTTGQLLAGLTVVPSRSIDGGSIGLTANSVVGVGSGIYKLDLAAADLNGNSISLILTAPGAADNVITIVTQP